ncbi:mannose-1-phosphate guanylyltransferase/mannose-6-phosphate isomerase [Breoghania corrubedonensis]|uniref:mannose-1-phosphate guanylyltransferase n=1 Tax=Breoghania corrubedonensis TaxID=665038 RepID=A0A2T5UW20_9HYPH|nr:mannose-1-phosphate guanylyltransferase/mannose-6-phosphate isomerase [Breoghania corrubedonensis]PTW55705.1 mannose-1-phosphate guanylyltransferase/mannose-6-phosphate isomerase [Breoghania corrubedonensis]
MIHPCILSGGSGSRLWPLSRKAYPKQFLKIFGDESLFQKTCRRVAAEGFSAPLVISNQDHRFLCGEQMAEAGLAGGRIVLEPQGRNTAAPAAVATLLVEENDPDGLILMLPSDHLITDEAAFLAAVKAGETAAAQGRIVTFGIRPSEPNTGYGYIHLGEAGAEAVRDVRAFVEKPDLDRAQGYLADGGYVWNAGIFLFSARTMKAAFEAHAPDILKGARAALDGAAADLDFLRLEATAFAEIENISFDYAIMERAANVACVPMDPGWSDLGSWSAVREVFPADENGNAALGDALFFDTRDSFVYSADASVAVLGLSDVLVVNTRDALLVAHKDKAQDVKKIVERLEAENRREAIEHKRVYRPWGWYEGLSDGARFQVKCIMVKPGAQLSLQSHVHRAEHWVVVSGTAEVTIDGEVRLVSENQSAYIPLAARHRLANPGKIPTTLIEVQSGSYLGEDDIIRYEDIYGREGTN